MCSQENRDQFSQDKLFMDRVLASLENSSILNEEFCYYSDCPSLCAVAIGPRMSTTIRREDSQMTCIGMHTISAELGFLQPLVVGKNTTPI